MTREKLIKILDESPFTKCSENKYRYNDSYIMLIGPMVTMHLKNNGNEIGTICLECETLPEDFSIKQLWSTSMVSIRFDLGFIIHIE